MRKLYLTLNRRHFHGARSILYINWLINSLKNTLQI